MQLGQDPIREFVKGLSPDERQLLSAHGEWRKEGQGEAHARLFRQLEAIAAGMHVETRAVLWTASAYASGLRELRLDDSQRP